MNAVLAAPFRAIGWACRTTLWLLCWPLGWLASRSHRRAKADRATERRHRETLRAIRSQGMATHATWSGEDGRGPRAGYPDMPPSVSYATWQALDAELRRPRPAGNVPPRLPVTPPPAGYWPQGYQPGTVITEAEAAAAATRAQAARHQAQADIASMAAAYQQATGHRPTHIDTDGTGFKPYVPPPAA